MCRNIRPLFNYDPPSTKEDIHAAALQFVRKISGYVNPSEANEQVFNNAVVAIAQDITILLDSLVTNAPKRDRALEIERARELSKKRFG